jgi:hypothetical protein
MYSKQAYVRRGIECNINRIGHKAGQEAISGSIPVAFTKHWKRAAYVHKGKHTVARKLQYLFKDSKSERRIFILIIWSKRAENQDENVVVAIVLDH